jgi:hypothetical protein
MKTLNPVRRWRTTTVLALGAVIGVMLVAQPAGAHFLPSITHIWHHIKPKADARYLPGGNLPAGHTIRGVFLVGGLASGGSQVFFDDISYGWTLRTAATEHYIKVGDTPPAACPGSVNTPKAKPGHLCVYEAFNSNASARDTQAIATGRYGTRLFVFSTGAGSTEIRGTWAATGN